MKFTLSWLKEHLETKAKIDVITDTLTNIGLEVENIEDKENDYKDFTIAKVISADKHPNADRLKVCKVETSKGNVQVVCGAPNAKSGMFGVFAPSDTFIPGTNTNLKKSEIRGVESNGMLLSERELGISDEHDGIIELTGKHKIGDPIASIYGFDDPVIEINLTPNRSDCLSVRGIARDLAAAGLGTLKDLKIKKIKGTFKSNIKWVRKFKKDEEYLCPGVAGRLFKNVKNSQSPEWLKRRLTLIGLRPISTLVDITNYVTFDLGRPLHVYDASKLSGNLVMRKSQNKEKCKTLDDKEYILSDEMVVISDDKSLHGIGGVMCWVAGDWARRHRLRTFSGVSAPSRVVRSVIDTAQRRPAAFASVLMERVVNSAALRVAITGSMVRIRILGSYPDTGIKTCLKGIRFKNRRRRACSGLISYGHVTSNHRAARKSWGR